MVDEALRGMDGDVRRAYSRHSRPSVAPERLLESLLPQSLYTICSERECALGMVRSARRGAGRAPGSGTSATGRARDDAR